MSAHIFLFSHLESLDLGGFFLLPRSMFAGDSTFRVSALVERSPCDWKSLPPFMTCQVHCYFPQHPTKIYGPAPLVPSRSPPFLRKITFFYDSFVSLRCSTGLSLLLCSGLQCPRTTHP